MCLFLFYGKSLYTHIPSSKIPNIRSFWQGQSIRQKKRYNLQNPLKVSQNQVSHDGILTLVLSGRRSAVLRCGLPCSSHSERLWSRPSGPACACWWIQSEEKYYFKLFPLANKTCTKMDATSNQCLSLIFIFVPDVDTVTHLSALVHWDFLTWCILNLKLYQQRCQEKQTQVSHVTYCGIDWDSFATALSCCQVSSRNRKHFVKLWQADFFSV